MGYLLPLSGGLVVALDSYRFVEAYVAVETAFDAMVGIARVSLGRTGL
jgi:hypothetical protein